MNKRAFKTFFKIHASNVDNAETQGFWKLTDEVLKTFLLESMPKRKNITLVDFGGGTGRWLQKLDTHFTNSRFILVDLSEDMLAKARQKIAEGVFKNTITIVHSDISQLTDLEDNSADYIISTYNPLSFCDEPQKVINEAHRILRPGGVAMITIQGYYNSLYSKVNNFLASSYELMEIFKERKVQWTSLVPKLWQLSQTDMEQMFKESGFKNIFSRGIACIIQPQSEDFDQENKKLGSLSQKLQNDTEFFDAMLQIELKVGADQLAVNRGMNILTIGKK